MEEYAGNMKRSYDCIDRKFHTIVTDVTQKSSLAHTQPLSFSPHAHTQRGAAGKSPLCVARAMTRGDLGVCLLFGGALLS